MLLDKVGVDTRRASGTLHLPLVALLGLVLIDGTKCYAILAQGTCHRSLAAIIFVMIDRLLLMTTLVMNSAIILFLPYL